MPSGASGRPSLTSFLAGLLCPNMQLAAKLEEYRDGVFQDDLQMQSLYTMHFRKLLSKGASVLRCCQVVASSHRDFCWQSETPQSRL